MLGGLAAVFLGLVVVSMIALGLGSQRSRGAAQMRRRLSLYTLSGRARPITTREEVSRLGDNILTRSAVEMAGKVVHRRDLEEFLGNRLDAAGIPLRPAEWLIIHVGIALVVALLFLLVGSGSPTPAVLGLGLGLLGPWLVLTVRQSRRQQAFYSGLPDTLTLLAGSLRAGYSLPQAVDAVAREAQPPVSSEFNRTIIENRLGMTIEDALDGVARRMASRDLEWVVMAIRIQREVGGNLAELLSTVAGTLRERERLRRQVKTLSAEGRLSAWILGSLPIVFTLYIMLTKPDYLMTMTGDPLGIAVIGFAVILFLVGVAWLSRVVKVDA
jgi:tight adherence protein B